MTAGKATSPSGGICGKQKKVDAKLDFAAYLCMGRSPCEQPRREKEQNRRVQRWDQPWGAHHACPQPWRRAWSARSISGPENRQLPAFASATAVHSSAPSAQSWVVQGLLWLSQTLRKFWVMCPSCFPLRRDFPMLLKDTTCSTLGVSNSL